jgi:hypothetical protein
MNKSYIGMGLHGGSSQRHEEVLEPPFINLVSKKILKILGIYN